MWIVVPSEEVGWWRVGCPWLDSVYSRCGSTRRDEKEAHFEQLLGSKNVTQQKKNRCRNSVTNREGVHFPSFCIHPHRKNTLDFIGMVCSVSS